MQNYTFITRSAFDLASNKGFTGNASLSLVANYLPSKGCYEAPRGLGDVAKIALATDADPEGYKNWRPLSDFKDYLPERYRSGAGAGAGHGGGDYYIVADFVDAVKKNVQPELNVYKAAEWTAVALLSQLSVTNGGRVMEMPHFRKNMPWAEKRIKL